MLLVTIINICTCCATNHVLYESTILLICTCTCMHASWHVLHACTCVACTYMYLLCIISCMHMQHVIRVITESKVCAYRVYTSTSFNSVLNNSNMSSSINFMHLRFRGCGPIKVRLEPSRREVVHVVHGPCIIILHLYSVKSFVVFLLD